MEAMVEFKHLLFQWNTKHNGQIFTRYRPRESGQLSTIIPHNHGITTRKMVHVTGQTRSFLLLSEF